MFPSMPVQRNILKNRELPLSNRYPCRMLLSAAATMIIFLVMAAAVFGSSEKAEEGMLILEDPCEKTRYAEYGMAVGDEFSITFIHSVNKSPVTDYFEIREDGIYGIKTVYYGFGAGVPTGLEEGQTLTYGEDGSMIISGFDLKMDSLIYRVGTVSDHILTLRDENGISLRDLCGRSARVGFYFETNGES